MKYNKFMLVILLLLVCSFQINSQSTNIPWSDFSSGFGNSGTSDVHLITSSGEPFIGSSGNGKIKIISGFLTFSQTQITGLKNEPGLIPIVWKLEQNFPNPFNPNTKINYSIKDAGLVKIEIYDILGRKVETLVNEEKYQGNYSVIFNAKSIKSGVYFYKLEINDYTSVKKMIFLK